MTVLITDDHNIFREGLAALLQSRPGINRILQCSNGQQAVEMVQEHDIDIVLMDIEMPVMNGIEATKRIRALEGRRTSVIALTMFNRLNEVVTLYDTGIEGYLLKDSPVAEVEKALKFVNEGKEYYCDAVKDVLFKALIARQRNKLLPPGDALTAREKEVLALICDQYSTEEIAEKLFLSPLTINNHRRSILLKTKSKNVAGMVLYAIQHGVYHLSEGFGAT